MIIVVILYIVYIILYEMVIYTTDGHDHVTERGHDSPHIMIMSLYEQVIPPVTLIWTTAIIPSTSMV